MKGHAKIEIFNKDGSLKTIVEKDNIITNIEDILQPNLPAYFECYNSTKINPLRTYSKLVENFMGGIFVFNSNNRLQDKGHMLPNLQDIKTFSASAGMNFTGNSSKNKGSRNLNETAAILDENGKEKGFRFVWDWGTGSTFKVGSLSLCSSNAGNHGLDFDHDLDTTTKAAEVMGRYNVKLDGSNGNYFSTGEDTMITNIPVSGMATNGTICYVSEDFKIMVMGTLSNNSYTLTKYNFRDNIKVTDNLNSITNDVSTWTNWEKDLIYNITPTSATLQNINYLFWEDDYIYSVLSKKSNNDITINFVKIDVTTMTIAEEKLIPISVDGFNSINSYVIVGNKLYVNDGDYDKIHCINLDTDTLENTINYTTRDSNPMYLHKLTNDILLVIKGYKGTPHYGYLIFLDHDNLANGEKVNVRLFGWSQTSNISNISPNNFKQVGNTPIFISRSAYSTSKEYFNCNLFELFFISILNLDSIIEKGEEESLKITYEITNE